ncbi:MAG: HEAT repeat domain-containing protein [Deltaproteobacteria bacterium]|nr:HEAT repeat domain-containing protein [Deltaproteobacteria bacterium]
MLWWTLRQLQSKNPKTRERAALKLSECREARAVGPLVAALRDGDYSTQRAAADALGAIGDMRAIEPLVTAFKDERVWWAAMDALVRIGPAAVGSLVAALRDRDENVRGRAAQALGRLRDTRAVDPLMAALKDKDWFVREAAAEALGRIGDVRAVGSLLALTADKAVAETAIKALRLVLENHAPQIAPENLQALAGLTNVVQLAAHETKAEEAIDWAEVRRLAQQELFRRALK